MKKYFIAVAALAFLAACNGKAAKDTPELKKKVLPSPKRLPMLLLCRSYQL